MAEIRRLPCLQHIKRKFLDIKNRPQAQEIARLWGLLYHFEHKHRIGVDGLRNSTENGENTTLG